jgi:hypothetical protein
VDLWAGLAALRYYTAGVLTLCGSLSLEMG